MTAPARNPLPRALRILSRAAGRPVAPGDVVDAALDRTVLNGSQVPSVLHAARERGRPAAPESVLLTTDFLAPEVDSRIPRSRALCREVALAWGLRHVFDLNMGIGSHVVVESALVEPDHLIAGCGRCLGVVGGIGALTVPLEPAPLAQALISGRLSLTVPSSVRVEVRGKVPRLAGPWDVAAAVADLLGPEGQGRVVELDGDTADWGIDLRLGVCGLLREMGAWGALVAPDDVLASYYRERGVALTPWPGDDVGGTYERTVTLEAKEIRGVWADRYTGRREPLPARDGPPVQDVFIGSCYGGRYGDLAVVTEVLKAQGRVQPGVRLVISPATLAVARDSLQAGFYETFLEAGGMLAVPGGGPGTAAGGAVFGEGEHIASTAEYHRHLEPGQGLPEVRILGPAAAAVAAATGRIADPSALMG